MCFKRISRLANFFVWDEQPCTGQDGRSKYFSGRDLAYSECLLAICRDTSRRSAVRNIQPGTVQWFGRVCVLWCRLRSLILWNCFLQLAHWWLEFDEVDVGDTASEGGITQEGGDVCVELSWKVWCSHSLFAMAIRSAVCASVGSKPNPASRNACPSRGACGNWYWHEFPILPSTDSQCGK